MAVYTGEFMISTRGEDHMTDITQDVRRVVSESGIKKGVVHIFVAGSTGAISTIEYEPGLQKDLPDCLSNIAPRDRFYQHHNTWGDDNGRGHVLATVIGPSLTVPVRDGDIVVGTWQQIIFLELDTRPRSRRIICTVMGE